MIKRGLLKEYSLLVNILSRIADVITIVVSAYLAHYYRFDNFTLQPIYTMALLSSILLTLIVFNYFGMYRSWRSYDLLSQIGSTFVSILIIFVSLIVIAYLTKSGEQVSRIWFVVWFLISILLNVLIRVLFYYYLRYLRMNGWNIKKVVVVGANYMGEYISAKIEQTEWMGFEINGYFDDINQLQNKECYLGKISGLAAYVDENNIDEVWIATKSHQEEKLKKVLDVLRYKTVNIRYIPDIFSLRLFKHTVSDIAGVPVLNLSESPMSGLNRYIKALEDRVLSLMIFILTLPLVILISVLVKIGSSGPVIYSQSRTGWDGREFKIYKFRTMVVHEESTDVVKQATANDSRVTKFGRFLRRTSLDELPQFLNVLHGDMSIVGPRPHALQHNEYYKSLIQDYMKRHKVKPGITGWAQINGFRGETEDLEKMEKRIEYDLYYIDNWSLWFDLKIILLTIIYGFVNKNAY